MEKIFDLQLFADEGSEQPGGENPGGEGGEQGGGENPGGGGTSSSDITWTGLTTYTEATVTSGETYTSTTEDENAVLISTTATVTINDATVTKSGGTSASDNYSFYGINSAVMCMGGGTTSISGGTVTTSAAGANGIFSYGANNGTTNATGDGTTVYIKDVTISTTGQGSGGIMTTYGGTTVAENLTITTDGGSSAPIRTDRGGGWVTVTGGSYTSNGLGSPAIYSTAEVTVNDAELVSNQSEGVCIEGAGTIALSNCTLTANNTNTNGNATFYDTIMIYQSQSGDASDGTSEFSMTGGTLNSQNGHVFHVTNTTAVINLDGVTINNSDSENILLSVCDDGWSGADNIVTLNASNQTLEGNILVGSDSTLTLNLEDSTFTGNISGEISNAAGTSVSTSIGTVNVTLDENSKWYLTGDTYISEFTGDAANIISNGFTLYENGVALDGTTASEDGGLNISNSNDNSLITGSEYADTISNTGDNVTINALAGDDEILISGESLSVDAGEGNDTIFAENDSATLSNATINLGEGTDVLDFSGTLNQVTITGAGTSNDINIGTLVSPIVDETTVSVSGMTSVVANARTQNVIDITNDTGVNVSVENVDGAGLALYVNNTSDEGTNNIYFDNFGGDKNNFFMSLEGGSANEVTFGDVTGSNGFFVLDFGPGSREIVSNNDALTIGDISASNDFHIWMDGGNDSVNIGNTAENVTVGVVAINSLTAEIGTVSDGGRLTFFGGNGINSITVEEAGDSLTFYGTLQDGNDYLNLGNIGENSTVVVEGGGGADTFEFKNLQGTVRISSGTPQKFNRVDNLRNRGLTNETLESTAETNAIDLSIASIGANSTVNITGGEDADNISIGGVDNATLNISTGAGNDSIFVDSFNNSQVTINAGAGDDYIELNDSDSEGTVIISSEGNDTITGVTSNTQIQGTFTASSVDGDNVILTTSDGSLTILDGAGETLNINGNETVFVGENPTLAAYLAEFMLHKTAAGYPLMAAIAFHPTDPNPAAPANYYSSETWTATSADNLQLSAVHYSPENPTGKWVILVHGYGKVGAAMNSFAAPYLAQGLDVLIVDQRAAGDSEGEWLTMGVAESTDLAIWTQEIANKNANAQITLHGVSMGAATVMMGAALSQTTNVTGIIEDCGYTNIANVFVNLMNSYSASWGISGDFEALFEQVAAATESLTGYNVAESVPLDSIAQVTVPSLFIHGTDDGAISVSNVEDLYNASGAESKTLLTIESAGHGKSAEVDSATYFSAITTLLENSTEEIGASINSDEENILVRGTIYDDTITASGDNVTIDGISGNDTVNYSENMNIVFDAESTSLDGEDVILKNDTSSIKILDAKGETFNLIDSQGNSNSTIIGGENLMDAVTINGITYTPASDDAALTYDSSGNVTGISSGTVEVTLADSTDPKITLDGTTAFGFTAEATDGGLKFTRGSNNSYIYVSGEATYTADSVSYPAGDISLKLSNDIFSAMLGTITLTIPSGGLEIPLTDEGEFTLNLSEAITAGVSGGTATGSISLNGAVTYDAENKSVTLAKGAAISVNDFVLTEGATALNFSITALEESTLAVDGLYLMIKDGASVNISGSTFGIEGDLTLSGGDLSIGLFEILAGQVSNLTISAGTTLTADIEGLSTVSITAPEEAASTLSIKDNIISVTANDDNGLNVSIGDLVPLPLNIKGTFKIDTGNRAITFTEGTVATVQLPSGATIQITANADATSVIGINSDGSISLAPNENDGTLNVAIINSEGTTILDAEVEVTSGSFVYNSSTNHITINGGTEAKVTVGDYTFTTSNAEDAGGTISFTESGGITYTPDTSDGTLTLTVEGTGDSQFSGVGLEVLSGSFTLNLDNSISIAQDTELKLDFSDTYSISFKTTDEAGGTLALVSNGISFTPGTDDGHLELTVTNGDTTRTASLEMTGTVTYTLGGNIELAEGTVVTNVFEDGKSLAITANTDASGTITFNPEGGLTITPASTDALNVVLTDGDIEIFNISYITGSITYSGGAVTASDGSEIRFTNYFYNENEMIMSTNGGTSSIKFNADSASYTAGEGAEFVLDYQDGETMELSNGTFTDNFDNTSTLTQGVVFKTNDSEPVYILATAGTYTLNGNNITTTADNVQVKLSDYDTVTFTLGDDRTLSITSNTDDAGTISVDAEGGVTVTPTAADSMSVLLDVGNGVQHQYTSIDGELTFSGTYIYFGDDTQIQGNVLVNDQQRPFHYEAQGSGANLNLTSNANIITVEEDGTTLTGEVNNAGSLVITDAGSVSIEVDDGRTYHNAYVSDGINLTSAASEYHFILPASGSTYTLNGAEITANEDNVTVYLSNHDTVSFDASAAVEIEGYTFDGEGTVQFTNGEFSFGAGTSFTKTFESGNVVTVSANAEDYGDISIESDTLTVTPSAADAITVQETFNFGPVYNFNSIEGTMTIADNVFSFEEGTAAATIQINGNERAVEFTAENGSGSVTAVSTSEMLYAAEDGATFTVQVEENRMIINGGGTLHSYINNGVHYVEIEEGMNIDSNFSVDENSRDAVFVLETAGSYTLNGNEITTSEDNVEVLLTNYDTVTFDASAGVTFGEHSFSGAGTVQITDGEISLIMTDAGTATFEGTTFELTEALESGTTITAAENGFTVAHAITESEIADDPNGESTDLGKIFVENISVDGDETYNVILDSWGIDKLQGISNGAVVTVAAEFDGTPDEGGTWFNVVTDEEGVVTFGDNSATISGDDSVTFGVNFKNDGTAEIVEVTDLDIGGSVTSSDSIWGSAVIANSESGIALIGTEYDDAIGNSAANVTITALEGDDVITNENADNVIIDAGAGNDSVSNNNSSNVSITAGDGDNQIILNEGENISVTAGDGNNTINAAQVKQLNITAGDGDNYIFGAYVTYDEERQAYVNYDSTTSATIVTGNGNDTVINDSMYQSSINAGDGDNVIGLYHSYENTLTTGAGNDSILVTRGSVENISTGAGNDSIIGELAGVEENDWTFGANATVDAGAGDDYIAPFYTDNSSIFGGEGNDTIIINGENTTINGGAGNDYIELTDNFETDNSEFKPAVIVASDGADTLVNYSDIVSISGDFDNVEQVGDNVILSSGNNSLTVTNYTEGFINIVDSEGNLAPKMFAGTFEVTDSSPVTVNDLTFSGNGSVSIANGNVSLNGDISVEGDIEEFMLAGIGNYTVNGKDFELITDVENAITISAQENGYSVSHIETAEEAELYGDPASAVGKTFTENLTVTNDDDYKLAVRHMGISVVSGISNNAQVQASAEFDGAIYEYGTGFNIVTDEEGVITLGETPFTISGDENVSLKADFNNDGTAALAEVEDLNGTISGNFTEGILFSENDSVKVTGDENINVIAENDTVISITNVSDGATILSAAGASNIVTDEQGTFTFADGAYTVNLDAEVTFNIDENANFTGVEGLEGEISGNFNGTNTINGVSLSISNGATNAKINTAVNELNIDGISANSAITTGTNDIEVNMTSARMTLNGAGYALSGDSDGVTINGDKVIEGLDAKASLTVAQDGKYTVNSTALDAAAGDIIIGVNEDYAYIFDSSNPQFSAADSTEEILDALNVEESRRTVATDSETSIASNRGGNAVIVTADSTDEKEVTLGGGGDIAVVEATSAPVNITGGKGKDTLVTAGEDVTFDMSAGGADKVVVTGGKVSLENYDPSTGAGVKLSADDVAAGVKFGDNSIELANAEVALDNNFVNIFDVDGTETKYGFASESNNVVDASKSTDDLILIGSGDSLTNAVEDSSILGGSGDDTIYGGSYIDAGKGKNYVAMDSEGGATLNYAAGRTSVDNLNFADSEDADTITTGDLAINGVKISDGDVVLKTDNGRIQIIDGENKSFAFKNKELGEVVAQVGNTELTYDGYANYFMAAGKNASISVEDLDEDTEVAIDLSDEKQFSGDFKDIDASRFTGEATLSGNDRNNVITASAGGSTLNGGKGRDSLIGGAGSDNFVYAAGDGKDTISGFTFGTGETADSVNTGAAAVAGVEIDGDDLILKFADSNDFLRIENGAGQNLQFANDYGTVVAQVSEKSLSYDGTADLYWAAGKSASVSLDENEDDAVSIWLNNDERGDSMFKGDIKYLDASGYEGTATLVGNDSNNVITANDNGSSLWGGNSTSNDTLIGGDGADLFWYENGNGDDVIVGAGEDDTVRLYGISLDMISIKAKDSSLKLNFSDGGSLSLDTNNGTIFKIGDSNYTYSNEEKKFVDKE